MSQATFPVGIVLKKPLVLATFWYRKSFLTPFDNVSNKLKNQPAIFFVFVAWSILDRADDEIGDMHDELAEYVRKYPAHKFIIAVNDDLEKRRLESFGLSPQILNHNAFYVNINTFKPTKSEKTYDVIYNAQLQPYKRHYLMEKIESACIIYSTYNELYYKSLPENFHKYYFANGRPMSESWNSLSPQQVSDLCVRAKVGLCLSQVEGAMLAAIEYSLCGLPIVSTKSLGGRDYFFDSSHTLIADSNPVAIKNAVEELISKNIDPNEVRATVLDKIFSQRIRAAKAVTEAMTSESPISENIIASQFLALPRFPWRRYTVEQLDDEIAN